MDPIVDPAPSNTDAVLANARDVAANWSNRRLAHGLAGPADVRVGQDMAEALDALVSSV